MLRPVSRSDAFAAYRDREDHPQLVESCVLFFDLMGIREMSKSGSAQAHLRRLRPALQAAVDRAGTEDRDLPVASTWFTDNAVVATPVRRSDEREIDVGGIEISAAYLLLVCWGRGFLGRGAITYGPHYMDEHFVFGPALIEAAELEKAAKWPRVVLSPAAVEVEEEHSTFYANPLTSEQSGCLACDETGTTFIDHLGIYIDEEHDDRALDHFLSLHRQATENGLDAHERESKVWSKWRWLAEYQNFALANRLPAPERYMIDLSEARYAFGRFLDPNPDTPAGSPWYALDRQFRLPVDHRLPGSVPTTPGVYAFYREGARMYAGATGNLSRRIEQEDLSHHRSMRISALRRNVAEKLGIAKAADIYSGAYAPTDADKERVARWLSECTVSWLECDSKSEAHRLKSALRSQHRPLLDRS